MDTVQESIEINRPVSTLYNQWTQFEDFPRFMEGVREVKQLDDTHLRWRAEIGGKEESWDAEITEQIPDERIAWRSTSGARNSGVVTFHPLADEKTKIMVQMDYEPEGAVENVGSATGAVSRRVQGDLERFKEFIEERGSETGAWRGAGFFIAAVLSLGAATGLAMLLIRRSKTVNFEQLAASSQESRPKKGEYERTS